MRKNTDCRQMIAEEKHAHRCAQKRASYAKRCGEDPTYRQRQAAAARARHEAHHGPSKRVNLSGLTPEQRKARKLEQQRESRQRRKTDPAYRARQRVVQKRRVAEKREWQRAHSADLNARRRAARLANPQKYRALEKAAKQRKRARAKLLPTKPQ